MQQLTGSALIENANASNSCSAVFRGKYLGFAEGNVSVKMIALKRDNLFPFSSKSSVHHFETAKHCALCDCSMQMCLNCFRCVHYVHGLLIDVMLLGIIVVGKE